MGQPNWTGSDPPLPDGYRGSGLLLHITSLPSLYGIGDLGPGAYRWIDRMHEAGQSWWQALPFGPTGYSHSPYQCLSSFVGNGLLISPDLLIEDGLLRAEDCKGRFSSTRVDYEVVIPFKHRLLELAWANFQSGARNDLRPAFEEFCRTRAAWLDDYALFRALKIHFNDVSYLQWPTELVERYPSALAYARRSLSDQIDQIRLAQFLLFRQAARLKEYADAKGIRLIGDLPFFVSPDSSDVWANPQFFLLDQRRRQRFKAGVPPDYFSSQGQLWGNPVYDWNALGRTGYQWCIDRMRALLNHVSVIRLDHFRAFSAAWHVPADSPTAQTGEWVAGPGESFFRAVRRELGTLPFIAEDLGTITPDVEALRDEFSIPGTRVLQFGFDGRFDNVHLPNNFVSNTVVYTGTHDNPTTREWFEGLTDYQQRAIWTYTKRHRGDARDVARELMRLAWSSRASLAIAPLQDLLNLGREGRMNVPGTTENNWRWSATQNMLAASDFEWLKQLTKSTNRLGRNDIPVIPLRKAAS